MIRPLRRTDAMIEDLSTIEAMATVEAQGNPPQPEHFSTAFVAWMFPDETPVETV